VLVIAACSKDKDVDQPAKLTDISATLKPERVWSASVADKGAKPLRLGLGLSVDGNRVYAAGRKGEVAAFDLQSGRALWRTKTKLALSGGPGSSAGMVVVGSTFGDLVALNPQSGAILWKIRLNGEVLSAPAISERLIAIRTVDGKLHAIDPKDGKELWSTEQQVPRLSLRGTASPVLTGEFVLCGFDNGKVEAVNVSDGSVAWKPPFRRRMVRPSWSAWTMWTPLFGCQVLTSLLLVSKAVFPCLLWTPGKPGGRMMRRAIEPSGSMTTPFISRLPTVTS